MPSSRRLLEYIAANAPVSHGEILKALYPGKPPQNAGLTKQLRRLKDAGRIRRIVLFDKPQYILGDGKTED